MTRNRVVAALCIAGLTLLGFFQFPGHTWLQQDTQIWVALFEHLWDPSALPHDLLTSRPHLSYTLMDEAAIALRWITRAPFHAVLTGEQLVMRAVELLGVYLLALALPLSRRMAMLVTACFGLGATIVGPAVLSIEYEPVPRGFALAFAFLAAGLAAQQRLMGAAFSAAAGFLFHPPTMVPVWMVLGALVLWRKQYRALLPLAGAVLVLIVAARLQVGATEAQPFFSRIAPEWEKLERMRASYNWVSVWMRPLIWQYLFLWAFTVIACWRIRPLNGRWFAIGLPLIGILGVAVSYALTEGLKWALMPQVQPARALLFDTTLAAILGAAAGIRAAEKRLWWESAAWFVVVFAIPMQARIFEITGNRLALAAALAALACAAARLGQRRAGIGLVAAAALAPYFVIPLAGRVRNYPNLETEQLRALAEFARANTPKDAVFLFPDAGQALYPGLFRATADRSVYVDWKEGGQLNYFQSFAEEWWARWQDTMSGKDIPARLDHFRALGIDYVVLKKENAIAGRRPVYQNSAYVVYRLDARNASTSARVGTEACAPRRVTERAAAALANRSAAGGG